jgi:DNA-binding transcriptional MerR regulator
MTKEQAINYLRSSGFSSEQIKEIVKALEQEPILDKIRAEIEEFEEEVFHRTKDYSDYASVRHCLDITNKYIAESENKECI